MKPTRRSFGILSEVSEKRAEADVVDKEDEETEERAVEVEMEKEETVILPILPES